MSKSNYPIICVGLFTTNIIIYIHTSIVRISNSQKLITFNIELSMYIRIDTTIPIFERLNLRFKAF